MGCQSPQRLPPTSRFVPEKEIPAAAGEAPACPGTGARTSTAPDAAQLQDGAASHAAGSAHTCVCLQPCTETCSEKLHRVLTAAKATNTDITRRVTKTAAEETTELLSC